MAVQKENIQGDIWPKLTKDYETFIFFKIDKNKIKDFKQALKDFIPQITTAARAEKQRETIAEYKKNVADESQGGSRKYRLPASFNIAFSHRGLEKLGKFPKGKEWNHDPTFKRGMLNDMEKLDSTDEWDGQFLKPSDIDGLLIITATVEDDILPDPEILRGTTRIHTLHGNLRPCPNRGKEHFGFEDGISQPQICGLDPPPKDKEPPYVEQRKIFLQDEKTCKDFPWAKDGSYLVFRKLKQDVSKFNDFLEKNKSIADNKPEKLGAQLMGRWRGGAPIVKAPDADDTKFAKDNAFDYKNDTGGSTCPFGAHIRKTRPRGDQEHQELAPIMRRGIPYGPELPAQGERGLHFVSYQSRLFDADKKAPPYWGGFSFIHHIWSDSEKFFKPKTGFDPIIGRVGDPPKKYMKHPGKPGNLSLEEWIVPRGGEYFFAPSIAGLQDIAKVTSQ